LAWIVHEAENANDDITFIAVMNEVERRRLERIFNDEYKRLWPEHAKARGYGADSYTTKREER
jgi:hypothetical protein